MGHRRGATWCKVGGQPVRLLMDSEIRQFFAGVNAVRQKRLAAPAPAVSGPQKLRRAIEWEFQAG